MDEGLFVAACLVALGLAILIAGFLWLLWFLGHLGFSRLSRCIRRAEREKSPRTRAFLYFLLLLLGAGVLYASYWLLMIFLIAN